MNPTRPNSNKVSTFVIVHGAWAGAWALTRVADILTKGGHRVLTPTLTGLGERSHLASNSVDLSTHVSDIVNEVLWKDLSDFVLVGVSYGGLVITGAAETLGKRVSAIVYVDAFIPEDGQSFSDITGWIPEGEMTNPPEMPVQAFSSPKDHAWVVSKVTPQPTATLKERLKVTGAYQRVPKKTYVKATGWNGPFDALAGTLRADPSWTVLEIACGHDVANLKPNELAAILAAQ